MRILIADSGATKTSWAVVDGNPNADIQTSGLNPVLKSDAEIRSVIFDELLPQLSSKEFDQIYFYGAGCRLPKNAERIEHYLKEAFPASEMWIKTDIEGAGLASFGKESGVIVISGTGSSAGFFNKGELVDMMASKAYPEGDYGSGCHIGALVLEDYFKSEAPEFIKKILDQHKKPDDELFSELSDIGLLKQISAKIMRDIGDFSNTDYLKDKAHASVKILVRQLKNHFRERILQYPVKLTGTTAFHFEDVFRNVFNQESIEIEEVQQNPILGLKSYYKNQSKSFNF